VNAIPQDADRFLAGLKNRQFRYVLFEEKYWPDPRIDLFSEPYSGHLQVAGRWSHPSNGRLVLFEVVGK
jgi:hypothetical protein